LLYFYGDLLFENYSSMKNSVVFFLFVFVTSLAYTQDRALAKTQLLYKQGNYRLCYWKADELVNNPEYDTTLIPLFYKSVSLFHLQGRFLFRKRNPSPWVEGSLLFKQLKTREGSSKFLLSHIDEVSVLKEFLEDELAWLQIKQDSKKEKELKKALEGLFVGVKTNKRSVKKKDEQFKKHTIENESFSGDRVQILNYAEQCLGIPYVFGGDSLDGFDCSGFTGYVYNAFNFQVGRSSRDQFQNCRKIEKEEVKEGDLIFFNSGGNEVTHVGIIISKHGEPLKMIHSSSSKGIIITEVETSEYWMKKLHGFGTFF
jgi:cell wall-associated NlpC family hydrolase